MSNVPLTPEGIEREREQVEGLAEKLRQSCLPTYEVNENREWCKLCLRFLATIDELREQAKRHELEIERACEWQRDSCAEAFRGTECFDRCADAEDDIRYAPTPGIAAIRTIVAAEFPEPREGEKES